MATPIFKASLTPTVPGITNQNLVPKSVQTPVSMGTKAVSPTTTAVKPPTTLPKAQVAPAPNIQSQEAQIASLRSQIASAQAAQQNKPAAPTPSYPGLMGAQIQAKQQAAPNYSTYVGNVAGQGDALNSQANTINQTATQIGSQGQMTPEELAARKKLADLTGIASDVNTNIESNPSDFAFQMGREAVAGRNIDARNQALAQTVEVLTGQRTAATAAYTGQANAQNQAAGVLGQAGNQYGTAAGYAAPQLGSIGSQQYYSPLGGSQSGSNTGSALASLPQQAQDAIRSYAQQVQNGQMTRADAESRLGAYGISGTNALNEALGSGFNTNSSNASAGTTATGQQVQTAATSTNAALDTLSSAFNSLPGWQTGGIPATNNLVQWIGAQFGSQALQQYKTNLADARSQLIGVLNSSGGTPTGNESTANEYLPDNMTKAQFDANVGTPAHPGIVRQLIAQKVSAFTGSGQQPNNTQNASSNSIWSF